MYCKKCGTEQKNGQKFCPKCGTPYPIDGKAIQEETSEVNLQPESDKELKREPDNNKEEETKKKPINEESENPSSSSEKEKASHSKNGMNQSTESESKTSQQENVRNPQNNTIVSHLNDYLGNEQSANIDWKIIFSDITKKHTVEQAEEIFIYGTRNTTPKITDVSKNVPHPWLYFQVLVLFIIAFVLLLVCLTEFHNPIALPGVITIGSFAVPLATIVLFLELNAWRNVSLYEIMRTFLIGGCASLVVTMVLYRFYEVKQLDYQGAFTVGFIEELGKAVVVYYFLKRLGKISILSGMLIGATVGAGFAAFESEGYAMYAFLYGALKDFFTGDSALNQLLETMFYRGLLSPGGHVAWAALSGAGLAIAAKISENVSLNLFLHGKFLRLFLLSVVLHGIWDSPIHINSTNLPVVQIGLVVFVWVVVLILINMGLSEIGKQQTEITKQQLNTESK